MATQENTAPSEAQGSIELVRSACCYVRLAVNCFGGGSEPCEEADWPDVQEAIRAATRRVEEWVGALMGGIDPSDAYDALDLLALVEAAIGAGMNPQTKSTNCPIAGAMRVALERLERLMEAEEPEAPAESSTADKGVPVGDEVHATTDSVSSGSRPLSEEDRDAVLEYLTELVPIAGVIYPDGAEATMHRGRAAVRRLANGSAKVLSLPDCADVLALLSHSEPRTNPFPTEGVKYLGFISLMQALEASLRQTQDGPRAQLRRDALAIVEAEGTTA